MGRQLHGTILEPLYTWWTVDNNPTYTLVSGVNETDIDQFANGVEELLRTLPNKTASGYSKLKFATREAKLSNSQKVYALMQCTLDLPPTDCLGCLYWAMWYINLHSVRGHTGAQTLLPSCYIRYELQKFYFSVDLPPSPPPQTATAPSSLTSSNTDCHTCLDFVTTNLTGLCPNQKEVIGWADNCMLRYSSRDILGGLWENEPSIPLISGDNVTDLDQFINVLQGLLESLTYRTASGDSRLKYATGVANVTASQKVYALMQCTPDLSEFDCLGCLSLVIRDLIHGDGVRGQTGARVLHPSCYARYEIQKFYSSPDSSPPPPSPNLVTTPSSTATSSNVVLAIFLLLILILPCSFTELS
ncbi:hypothetical protein V2J09_019343 [Rumex salicifolius]